MSKRKDETFPEYMERFGKEKKKAKTPKPDNDFDKIRKTISRKLKRNMDKGK